MTGAPKDKVMVLYIGGTVSFVVGVLLVSVGGMAGSLVTATIGAIILLYIVGLIKKS
jgi:uncharacterized membrane protein YeaQ/YmgE (transglycosylase-associated protein family)